MDSTLVQPTEAPGAADRPGTGATVTGVPQARSSYDDVPYSVGAFPQTSPDRLATVATLFGMTPAPPASCRVLELGCASGGNIVPMALAAPQSRFVGIDLSARQIADGQAIVSELCLGNVELRQVNIAEIGDDLGQFDYILCHGVYSWVPPQVQAAILRICKRNLVENGVAYISYNCYPGWHARGAIREMIWYHTERFADPAQRVRAARGLLALLAKTATITGAGGYAAMVRQELAILLATPDSYLLHEHLEDYNEPLYFHQFAQRAAEAGLQYLSEAQVSLMLPTPFGQQAEQLLRQISPDLLHMEQYMDFLRNRMFRQTLLCHAELPLDHTLRADAVRSFYITSNAKPVAAIADLTSDAAVEYKAGSAVISTRDPLMKAAMTVLTERWPLGWRFNDLVTAAHARLHKLDAVLDDAAQHQLATRLLNCYTSGLVELSLSVPSFITVVSQHPVASPYARLCARDREKVTTMKLQSLILPEAARIVLRHLDGAHDAASLADILAKWLVDQPRPGAAKPLTAEVAHARATEYISKVLPEFARAALLVAPAPCDNPA